MKEVGVQELLSGFLKLFPPRTVHIDGSFEHLQDITLAFLGADNTLVTKGGGESDKRSTPGDDSLDGNIVFAAKEEEREYHHLSYNLLSGLVPPDHLVRFWKNINSSSIETVKTATLEDFYSNRPEASGGDVNWLCIGGLRGLEIIEGLGDYIENIEGLVVRLLVEDHPEKSAIKCYSEDLDALLQRNGLHRVADFGTRHPAFRLGLYVRSYAGEGRNAQKALSIEQEKNQHLQKEMLALESAVAEHKRSNLLAEKQLAELNTERKALEAELSAAMERVEELENEGSIWEKLQADLNGLDQAIEKSKAEMQAQLNGSEVALKEHLHSISGQAAELVTSHQRSERLYRTDLLERLRAGQSGNKKQAEDLAFLRKEVDQLSHINSMVSDLRFNSFLSKRDDKKTEKELWLHHAEFAYRSKRFSRAAEYFQLALEAGGPKAWCIHGLAESMARSDDLTADLWYVPEQKIQMDRQGRWDAVVRTYRRALSLNAEVGLRFNNQFPSELLMENRDPIDNPIFIVGCGHSGTSILLRILGNHKDVWSVRRESGLFLRRDSYIAEQMEGWDQNCHAAEKARWVEKTPPNIFQLSRLLTIRPKSQIVLIVRDGRDVVASLKNRRGYENVQDRIDRWLFDNMAAKSYWEHKRVHMLKYEDLVSQPTQTLENLCAYLKLPYDENMVNFHETQENWYTDNIEKPTEIRNIVDHNNLRNWQVNQPIFDGRSRWKKGMSKSELNLFNKHCTSMMTELGYEC